MDLTEYDKQRQEFEAGVHRPSDMSVDPNAIESGLTISLSLKDYSKLAEIFQPLAEATEGITLADYNWRSLAPPLEHYSHERPLMMRLDLVFEIPTEFRLPILFKIETNFDLAYAASIAASGMIALRLIDAPEELDGLELPIAVPWPELEGMIHALLASGVIEL